MFECIGHASVWHNQIIIIIFLQYFIKLKCYIIIPNKENPLLFFAAYFKIRCHGWDEFLMHN